MFGVTMPKAGVTDPEDQEQRTRLQAHMWDADGKAASNIVQYKQFVMNRRGFS